MLDTNTVLDWLVFRDPCARAVGAAVETGSVRWLASARMRDELGRALAYPALQKWKPDSEHTLGRFDAMACLLPDPPPAAPGLRCSDANDQVFVDLAVSTQARWLLTHDRALLRLARRAAALGLAILKPGAWPGP